MRVDFMKFVDRWAGGFACFALDLFDRLRRLVAKPGPIQDPRHILITKYLGLGSLALATPMVAELRRRFPQAKLLFLTFEENRLLAERLGCFDEIRTLRSKSLLGLASDTLSALAWCWHRRVDLVFDLEFFTRYSAMMSYLSGARWRVGYWSRIAWRGDLLTHPVYYNSTKHITRVFLAQVEACGVGGPIDEQADFSQSLAHYQIQPGAAEQLAQAFAKAGLDAGKPWILVNPNASELCLERRWMPERFAAVVDRLLQETPGLQAAFIGSARERDYTEAALGHCQQRQGRANLAGQLDLDTLMVALRGAKLFLTNDSGPLHLATLMQTPTVALFGPETPTLYGPIGPGQKVFYSGVYCSPCLNVYNSKTAPCHGNNICMQAIDVGPVGDACMAQLGAR